MAAMLIGELAHKDFLRLTSKFTIGDGCWEWTGAEGAGYGQIWWNGRRHYGAHRAVYELMVGPIPAGMHLDHLCRNPRCVRPDHLEPVTPRENTLRGVNFIARFAAQTACKRGHPFDEENTYKTPQGSRMCRACHADSERRRRARGAV